MFDITKDFEELLISSIDVPVYYSYPENFNELPIISYYRLLNEEGLRADNKEMSQIDKFIIDIWGEDPIELGEIEVKINKILQKNGWSRKYAMDIPKQSAEDLNHKSMQFHKETYFK